mgnify:CR=1 FL=1
MIDFIKIDPNNLAQAQAYTSWYRDPIMINNWTLQKEKSKNIHNYSVEQFQKEFSSPGKTAFMLRYMDQYIGYGSFYINHPVGMYKDGRTCWPSIGIGDAASRGKGFGRELCKEVLRQAKELDCTHIEAGIFEFNEKIKKILLSNKFKYLGEVANKTFVDGKWCSSEHYLLKL